jgi:hypothetical protein
MWQFKNPVVRKDYDFGTISNDSNIPTNEAGNPGSQIAYGAAYSSPRK